jgi:hypothetical protein
MCRSSNSIEENAPFGDSGIVSPSHSLLQKSFASSGFDQKELGLSNCHSGRLSIGVNVGKKVRIRFVRQYWGILVGQDAHMLVERIAGQTEIRIAVIAPTRARVVQVDKGSAVASGDSGTSQRRTACFTLLVAVREGSNRAGVPATRTRSVRVKSALADIS